MPVLGMLVVPTHRAERRVDDFSDLVMRPIFGSVTCPCVHKRLREEQQN